MVLPACASGPAASRITQPAPTADRAPAAGAIDTVTLERDCTGCPTGSRLELRRDGSATLTVTGKARLGTRDQVSRARLAAGEFETLARAVVAAGFFTLPERLEEPGLQDGAWSILTVTRGPAGRQVFRRDDAGPASLKALEARVVALQARLAFVPAPP